MWLLASSKWRAGRLPNTAENDPAPNVSTAEAENTGHTGEEATPGKGKTDAQDAAAAAGRRPRPGQAST